LQFDPEHISCTNLRAIALVKLGRKAEAGATIDAALAKNPDNAVTHANQGWTLLEQSQPEKALHHFREALRLDPDNEWARAGIIEALKARHFIYSLFLRYFLWMAKLNPNVQWGIILAGWFGNRLLGAMAQGNPQLAPFIWPVRLVYLAFVFLTWTADPLFNLLLRLNRFGRLALTEEKTHASNWIGGCILLALLALGACLLTGFSGPTVLAPLVFGFLIIPLAGTFNCPEGWPRKMMAGYTAIMAAAGLAGLALALAATGRPKDGTDALTDLMTGCLIAFFIGAIGSSWVANFLMTRRPRR
jgi:tetratricopeptide (TPR) repeat protein